MMLSSVCNCTLPGAAVSTIQPDVAIDGAEQKERCTGGVEAEMELNLTQAWDAIHLDTVYPLTAFLLAWNLAWNLQFATCLLQLQHGCKWRETRALSVSLDLQSLSELGDIMFVVSWTPHQLCCL